MNIDKFFHFRSPVYPWQSPGPELISSQAALCWPDRGAGLSGKWAGAVIDLYGPKVHFSSNRRACSEVVVPSFDVGVIQQVAMFALSPHVDKESSSRNKDSIKILSGPGGSSTV